MSKRKPCEQCGKAFVPAKPWARFCTAVCRVQHFRGERRSDDPASVFAVALQGAIQQIRDGEHVEALEAVRAASKVFGATLKPDEPRAAPVKRAADTRQTDLFETLPKRDEPRAAPAKPARVAGTEDALRERFLAALEAGARQTAIAKEIGFADGSILSRWRKPGAAPLPEPRRKALAKLLEQYEARR